MNPSKHRPVLWALRSVGVGAFAVATLFGTTGQVFAGDGDKAKMYGPNACTTIVDIPLYSSATCVMSESEVDDGVTEVENTYISQDSADTVRLFFENAFRQNGWAVVKAKHDARDVEWDYTISKNGRKVKVEVEAQNPRAGTGTEISIEEK